MHFIFSSYAYDHIKHKCTGRGGGGGVFEKLCQSGKFSKIICKYSGKNETETVQNYQNSYQESYV